MDIIEMLKAIIYGIIEGVTEWLPISSTGHLIIIEQLLPLNVSPQFLEMFRVVIQLGAVLAVCVLFFKKLNPFSGHKSPTQKNEVYSIWVKIIIGCIPAGVLGILFDDWFDSHFYNAPTVAAALIIYGILFIVLEKRNARKDFRIRSFRQMGYQTAFLIGCIQVLALVPGTSRSGSTILGAMLLGVSRGIAAEYSFFLSVPVMFGASLIKILGFIKDGAVLSGGEVMVLAVATAVAFFVSVAAIRFLVSYVKKHDFKAFGYYRIILGLLVIAYFFFLQ